jgi:23S rRNA (guanosine2251-2'-O)-methyltransferase
MALLYGIHSVQEALQATENRIERICVERGARGSRIQKIIETARARHITISFEDRSWLDKKAAGNRHQGVLCYLAEGPTFTVSDVLEKAHRPGLLLILDGIEDPHNLGAILRSAEVAGADGILLPKRRSAGISPGVAKASAGAIAHIKVARGSNTSRMIASVKEHGYWVAGLDAESATPIWQVDLTGPIALVMGNEQKGLHSLVKKRCDFLMSIPVHGDVSSYNVSVSAGIALYECLRQRATLREQ